MSRAYYNEIDPFAAAWLNNLILEGVIAYGDVDTRSIEDVTPNDLAGYTQCHFFAGIGVWSYALRRAGWPDDRPVWTGSCPCQPFSAAGKRGGFADARHLWPAWFHLIDLCRPRVVFGEQVASKDGLAWLDTVQADLEGAGYAVGAADLCAAGVGAPHIRQRLYFVADAERERREVAMQHRRRRAAPDDERKADGRGGGGASRELADDDDARLEGRREPGRERAAERAAGPRGLAGELAHHHHAGQHREQGLRLRGPELLHADGRGPTNGAWLPAEWIPCRDEKWRPVEPGTFPLVNGAPARVGRLRGYGNAIVAPVAEEFVRAYLGA